MPAAFLRWLHRDLAGKALCDAVVVEFKISSIRFPLLGKAGHGGRYGVQGVLPPAVLMDTGEQRKTPDERSFS
jgi:hypothetical protein